MCLLQLPHHRAGADKEPVPADEELIVLSDPEPGQPLPHRIDVLGGPTVDIIYDIAHLNIVQLLLQRQGAVEPDHAAQREQGTDGGLAVMHTAAPIDQQRTGVLRAAGDHMDNGHPTVTPGIDFRGLLNDLLHGLTKFMGDVIDIARREDDGVLILTAFTAATTFEAECGVQIHQVLFQLIRIATFP